MRHLTYYVGATLDGYIAAPEGNADFFAPDDEMHDFIAKNFPDTIPTHLRDHFALGPDASRFDTVIMGRETYQPALEVGITDPYAHLHTFVVSTTMGPVADENVEIVDDPVELVRRLKARDGDDIWLAGGGVLAGALLAEIDELVLKSYPIIAGTGIGLFETTDFAGDRFTATDTNIVGSGTIVTTYRRQTTTDTACRGPEARRRQP